MLSQLILKNRSYRRFHEDIKISREDIRDMINNARLSASGRNMQTLKYIISSDQGMNNKIFPCLAWAGYLKDWPGPQPGERPSAYIVMLHDKTLADNYFCDDGIAAQSILLTAVEKGYGGCILGSVKRNELAKLLSLPSHLEILYVIALGEPAEIVVIDEVKEGDIRYRRDENEVHHVPKRSLKEIIVGEYT